MISSLSISNPQVYITKRNSWNETVDTWAKMKN